MKDTKKLFEIYIMIFVVSIFVILIHTSSEPFNYYDKGTTYC